jgi:hypothetical protein
LNTLPNAPVGPSLTAEYFLNLSVEYYESGNYEDSIRAARSALQLRVSFSEAWNNICAAYNNLGQFEEGRIAGEEATRLDPSNWHALNNLQYSFERLAAAPHQEAIPPFPVRSYDLFKTLITRRCHEPSHIFDIVEERSELSGFADARKQAEREISHGSYTLDNIYLRLQAILNLPLLHVEELRTIELTVEEENIIAIRDMIERIRPGDIIVSDTYLPADFLSKIIAKLVGIDNPLFLNTTYKVTGQTWADLKERHYIAAHIGDHPNTDFEILLRMEFHPS